MRKAKPTLKQYLNSYQNKKLNKTTSDDLPLNANSFQLQLSKIDDRIENIKLTLKDKIDKQTYESVCGDLDEVKSIERLIFMEKMETTLNGESGRRSSIQRSSILKSCLGQRASRNSKNLKFDAIKQNLQPPPMLMNNTLKIEPNDKMGKVIEQSQVFIKQEGLFDELYSIKENIESERKQTKVDFIVPSLPPNFGAQRPSISNYLVVEESQAYQYD